MIKEIVIIGFIGFGQNPGYILCPKEGVKIITSRLDEIGVEYKIGNKLPKGLTLEKIPEFNQNFEKNKNLSLDAILPENQNYISKINEKNKCNYLQKEKNYSNKFVKKPEFYRRINLKGENL